MRGSLYGFWNVIAQRPHHLAGALLRAGWQVDTFSQRGMRDRAPPLDHRPAVHYRTLPPGRLYRSSLTASLARRYQRHVEHGVFSDFTSSQADLFIYYHRPHEYAARIGALPGPLVYDCMDDWAAFGYVGAGAVQEWEQRLCERADRIWVVSRHLQEKLSDWKDKVRYVPNGVDYAHFARARDMRAQLEADPQTRTRAPRLIYIGSLEHWFDARLVGEVAGRLPDWLIQVVGPSKLAERQRAWLDRDNIHFLGKKDYHELPSLLAAASVAMIPFLLSDLIRGTSPIKLYEYLAAGVPVVSSSMPEVLAHVEPGAVVCADDPTEFARLVEECAASGNPDRCQAIAHKCSWDSRFLPAVHDIGRATSR
ncbi:glycosyltransferase [Steroidobacter denitrificans]|nr:glycosyltransferase [Steroidobacter denitrificans]